VKTIFKLGALGAISAIAMLASTTGHAQQPARPAAAQMHKAARTDVSDAALVMSLPGFRNGYAEVNGVRLHYVIGGKGAPLVLLPGWPQTWWTFHKMLPELAEHYTVIDVDLRGMGGSSRPAEGYDKKTMAKDIRDLVQSLGYDKVDIAGHDRAEQDWLFKYFLVDESAMDARDRAVYERAYDSADAIRASNAWYQTVTQDVIDYRAYDKLEMPVLAMGGPAFRWMKKVVPAKVANLTAVNVEHCGHFIQEEQPAFVTKTMLDFLQGHPQDPAS